MDVAGCEYEIIDDLVSLPKKPLQLLAEFHHRFHGIGLARTDRSVRLLSDVGRKVFAVLKTGRHLKSHRLGYLAPHASQSMSTDSIATLNFFGQFFDVPGS